MHLEPIEIGYCDHCGKECDYTIESSQTPSSSEDLVAISDCCQARVYSDRELSNMDIESRILTDHLSGRADWLYEGLKDG